MARGSLAFGAVVAGVGILDVGVVDVVVVVAGSCMLEEQELLAVVQANLSRRTVRARWRNLRETSCIGKSCSTSKCVRMEIRISEGKVAIVELHFDSKGWRLLGVCKGSEGREKEEGEEGTARPRGRLSESCMLGATVGAIASVTANKSPSSFLSWK